MTYQHLLKGIERFGGTKENIARVAFKCDPELIQENVILAPIWEAEIFAPHVDKVTPIAEGIRVLHELSLAGRKATFVRSGPGSPAAAYAVLALSCTPCKNIIFIGSVGGLVKGQELGDVIIPEYSVTGDGASRYITSGSVKANDCFGERNYPDPELYAMLRAAAKLVCSEYNKPWHTGKTFSIDNIFAEYAHLDEIVELGCDSIEMETALVFRAAAISRIKAGAVFSVSDNSFGGTAIYSNRTTDKDREYREYIRNNIVTRIVLETLKAV
jgi:purine-nucleoside phosphorylase